MTQIEIGVKYTPQHPDWAHVIADLREGDHVEAWYEDVGTRGTLGSPEGSRLLCAAGTVRWPSGQPGQFLTELTVTKLAPRKPDWWGARVIADEHGHLVYNATRDRYIDASGDDFHPADLRDSSVAVLIDTEGNLTWDAVEAEFGERIRKGVYDGLQPLHPTYRGVYEAIRAACGGDPK